MSRLPKTIAIRAPAGMSRGAFLDAAHRMIDRAWVRVDERRGSLTVFLTPRGAGNLAGRFRSGLAAAARLHRAEPGRRRLQAAIAARALELLDRPLTRRPQTPLAADRLAEIERLVAEDEAAPRDPLGLRTPWDQLRAGVRQK